MEVLPQLLLKIKTKVYPKLYKTPLPLHPVILPLLLGHSAPTILVTMVFVKYAKHTATSGLCTAWPLSLKSSLSHLHGLPFTPIRSLFKCHLLRKAYAHHPTQKNRLLSSLLTHTVFLHSTFHHLTYNFD